MKMHEALQDVDIAFDNLEFAIKLLSFCELGKIDPSDFDTDHIVQLEQGSLHFPTGKFGTVDSLVRASSICVLVMAGASALVLDNAFEVAGIKADPETTDKVGLLRTLVYTVRCAYAHGIAEPRWEVRGKYCRTISVDLDGVSIVLDLKALHGRSFDVEQLGGYINWYRIRDAAVAVLSKLKP